MATLLLLLIYLAFISLGLPDAILGAAWPVMQPDFGVPLETAGLLFMTIASGTIVSSLASGAILKRVSTGPVTLVSSLMTALALLGFSFAPSLVWLFLLAVPLGLGAGAVDTALNNYVAAHYKAHHMSWLHSFWGVGATAGPIVMAQFLTDNPAWRSGYLMIAGFQFSLVIILLLTLPLWGKKEENRFMSQELSGETETKAAARPLQEKGVVLSLLAFLFYCGIESTVGLWGSSFLVESKGLTAATAAGWVSVYYGGITIGRFITGFVTFKVSNKGLIRAGQWMALAGAALVLVPLPPVFSLAGFLLIGLGLAPIFPCMLHETPVRFGKKHAQSIMGYQMAVAYTGSTFLPPLFGIIASGTTIGLFPLCAALFVAGMLISSERLNHVMKQKQRPVSA